MEADTDEMRAAVSALPAALPLVVAEAPPPPPGRTQGTARAAGGRARGANLPASSTPEDYRQLLSALVIGLCCSICPHRLPGSDHTHFAKFNMFSLRS